ncbi:uncharacterized protein LOC132719695, partial [Ruditapes philippinarum]|uniref:uncharacterized protein LOC132719695 n=1 Tax=Ruditapes philippinarum TaxID=129788 RepID=UPI00295BB768
MDVVIFTFILDSFPRYNNAMKRISDILDRAKTLLYTVGKSHLSNTSIKRIHHDILKIYHCEKEGLVKLDLNADKLAMKSHGVQDKLTCKFDNTKSFLTHYLNSFSSTNVLIFQYYNGLIQTLEKCLPPEQPVIIVAKKQNGNITETYCHPNWKTVSTEENISEEISSLLEQMAFLPMTKTFENIKSIFEESHEHKVSTPLSSTNGMYSSKHNLSKFIDGEIRIPGDVSREMNGFKRKLDEIKGNDHTKMK